MHVPFLPITESDVDSHNNTTATVSHSFTTSTPEKTEWKKSNIEMALGMLVIALVVICAAMGITIEILLAIMCKKKWDSKKRNNGPGVTSNEVGTKDERATMIRDEDGNNDVTDYVTNEEDKMHVLHKKSVM